MGGQIKRLMEEEADRIRDASRYLSNAALRTKFGRGAALIQAVLDGYNGIPEEGTCTECGDTMPHTYFTVRNDNRQLSDMCFTCTKRAHDKRTRPAKNPRPKPPTVDADDLKFFCKTCGSGRHCNMDNETAPPEYGHPFMSQEEADDCCGRSRRGDTINELRTRHSDVNQSFGPTPGKYINPRKQPRWLW